MSFVNLRGILRAAMAGALSFSFAAVAQASYFNLGPAGDFNVFVFGDNNQTSSDAEGRVAVGGNVNFGSGYTVAALAPGNNYNLIVGGNLTTQSNSLNGGLWVGGNVNWVNPSISGPLSVQGDANFLGGGGNIAGPVNVLGTYSAPNWYPANAASPVVPALPFSFSAVQAYLQSESLYLSNLPTNGSTTLYYSQVLLEATGPASSLYVFDVTGADLAAAAGHGMSITAPAGSTVVVNVDGLADSLASMAINLVGVDRQHVLYNFHQATTLSINSIAVQGSVLAPWANVNFIGGQLNGTLISQSVMGIGQANLALFQGNLPVQPTPEPATWALAASGAVAILVIRRSRRPR